MNAINQFFHKIFKRLTKLFHSIVDMAANVTSISKRCGALSRNNFSSPLSFPLGSFVLLLRYDTSLSNAILFLTTQLKMNSTGEFLLKENFPWKSKRSNYIG